MTALDAVPAPMQALIVRPCERDTALRHSTKFLRWLPDKSPRQCTLAQLEASPP